jgi:hypothetical protein
MSLRPRTEWNLPITPLAKKCFPTLGACALSLLLVQAARADFVINVIATPLTQNVLEGAGGSVNFFIFNSSTTSLAFVDAGGPAQSTTPLTTTCSFVAVDATDKITCGTVGLTTTGSFVPGTNLIQLGMFGSGTNEIQITVPFSTGTLDNGPLNDGKNLVSLSFYAAEHHGGAALTDPTHFGPCLFCTNIPKATVFVSDTPEPSTLASMLVPLGLAGFLLYRVRVKTKVV